MKVLVNGGLNISELDGWWAEAFSPDVGWALGDDKEHTESGWDATEALQLYDLLEQKIIPEFYDRDMRGIPVSWIGKVRLSMATLTPRFSSNRMLREYVEKIYLPTAHRFSNRTLNQAALAKELYTWHTIIEQLWADVHFGNMVVKREHDAWNFETQVYLGKLDPSFVRVEIYAAPVTGIDAICKWMAQVEKLPGEPTGYWYKGSVLTTRRMEDFTLRIVPAHNEALVPVEDNHILWQR
jgi:starch phosphorylase